MTAQGCDSGSSRSAIAADSSADQPIVQCSSGGNKNDSPIAAGLRPFDECSLVLVKCRLGVPRLKLRRRTGVTQRWKAAAQYRGVVLVAFQNVADELRALQADARMVSAATAAEQSASRSIELVRSQVERGRQALSRGGLALRNRAADLGRDLLVQVGALVSIQLDVEHLC